MVSGPPAARRPPPRWGKVASPRQDGHVGVYRGVAALPTRRAAPLLSEEWVSHPPAARWSPPRRAWGAVTALLLDSPAEQSVRAPSVNARTVAWGSAVGTWL